MLRRRCLPGWLGKPEKDLSLCRRADVEEDFHPPQFSCKLDLKSESINVKFSSDVLSGLRAVPEKTFLQIKMCVFLSALDCVERW